MKSKIIVDMSQGQWREKSVSGSGNRLEIFDGKDLFSMEEGGEEYTRVKRRSKDPIRRHPPTLQTKPIGQSLKSSNACHAAFRIKTTSA